MKRIGVGVALILLATGCDTLRPRPSDPVGLDQFAVLSTPRDEIRVGAQWQQEIGPDGQGASSDDLTVSKSYNTVETNSNFGAKVAASLYKVLGLSAEVARHTTTVLRDVEVVTLSDLSSVTVQSGSDVLYEAVRVGSVEISTTDVYGAQLSTAALEQFGGSSVSMGGTLGESATVTAKDLFVAYRVISLGEPVVTRKERKLKSTGPVEIGNYSVTVDPGATMACACPMSEDGKFLVGTGPTPAKLGECTSQNPLRIYVENFFVGRPGSGGLKKQFTYPWAGVSALTLDTRIKSSNIEVDQLRVAAALSNVVTHDCLLFSEEAFNGDVSSVELISIKYPFRAHPNPTAPGW